LKYIKPLLVGIWIAIKVFFYLVIVIVPMVLVADYFGGRDINVYFISDFGLDFLSNPLIVGLISIFILLSCINQIVLFKRNS